MRLYLIRHPPPLVAPGLCYGSTDLAVLPAQQERVAAQLAKVLPPGLVLYSSPLQRCAGLAQALAQRLGGGPVRYDARLAELDFGQWEMQPWDAIPRTQIDAWASDVAHYQPGAGESVAHMAQRISAFMDALRQSAPAQPPPDSILVCHAGTIRLLLAYALGLAPAAMAEQAAHNLQAPGYGQWLELEL